MPRVFGYVVALVGDGPSVEEQAARLRELFERHYASRGFAWDGVVAEDAVGCRPRFDKRDGGGRLCTVAEQGDVILVVCAAFAFRSMIDLTCGLGWLAGVRGVSFHAKDFCAALGPVDPAGEAKLRALAGYVTLDRLIVSHRHREGHARSRERPRRSRQTPFGLMWVGRGKNRRLVSNPVEREYGAQIFNCRAKGMGWGAVPRHFEKAGVRFWGKCPTVSSIRRHHGAESKLREQETSL